MNSPALLKLMHLVSPALPVGAYAYSGGQEYAVDSGWIKTDAEIANWIRGIMHYSMANLDLPVLTRLYRAWETEEKESVNYWNNYLRACRESKELLLEDEQMGLALQRLLISLNVQHAELKLDKPVSFITMFTLAGVQ